MAKDEQPQNTSLKPGPTMTQAEEIMHNARVKVREEKAAKLEKRMADLYRRRIDAKAVLGAIEREIEMAEAEIKRELD